MSVLLPPLLLVGGGKMGGALLAGWRECGLSEVVVVDPGPHAAALADEHVTVVATVRHVPAAFVPVAVILAVKPQVAADAVPPLARFAPHAMFVSIMAGKTIDWLTSQLGAQVGLVRAMPNTPAAIRRGITVACAANLTPEQQALSETLLAAVGMVSFVADERLLDPVTAISGGGPAYVFLLAELLESAAIAHGIPAELARDLARQTIIGAGALLAASTEPAADLRRAVTSPNGTTQEALAILMSDTAWPDSINRAIQAATARSRSLGS